MPGRAGKGVDRLKSRAWPVVQTSAAAAPDRFFDALLGGTVALLFSQVLFPVDPARVVRGAVEATLEELSR